MEVNIIRPDYQKEAVEIFRKQHKNDGIIKIVVNRNGTFGIIKNYTTEDFPKFQAIPIYVEYPVAYEYLEALYYQSF